MRTQLWPTARRALVRRGWRARRATAVLVRALRSRARPEGDQPDAAEYLLKIMLSAPDEAARAMARAAVDEAWSGAGRDRVWRAVWRLLGEAHLGWRVHQDDDKVRPLLKFLLEPDAGSRYVPRVRLLACLQPVGEQRPSALAGEPEVAPLVELAISGKDTALFDLLCTTDHPRLLTQLADALRECTGGTSVLTDDGYVPVATTYGLWDDDGDPLPLLRILLTNPHLTVPSQVPDMALVFILRDRFDLLRECDQEALARTLLAVLATDHEPIVEPMPSHVLDRCRRAIRELPPGPGRDLVCQRAIAGDVEAGVAVLDAGFLPSDAALAPLLLYLTGQWERYDDADPDGRALAAAVPALPRDQVKDVVTRLFDVHRVPAAAAEKARSALRHLPPPEELVYDDPSRIARDTVCEHALRGNAEAKAAAIDAGYLPSVTELHPAFLFLTEQWDAYDRLDPDGARLRDQLATKPWLGDVSLPALRKVAKRAGRPDPTPPPRRPTSRRADTPAGTHHTDHGTGDGGSFDSGGHSGFSGSFGI